MQVEQSLEEAGASEPDMSWIDVAVQHGGRNAVIIDCADGWKDYLSEFYIEDCVETSVVLPAQAGLYRWSGFNVGYWGEDELCQINGGTFARFEASLPPPAPVDRPLVDDLTGALRFILAFYEPGQRYLDSEAWKCAEAGGRAALARGEAALATPSVLAESTSNDCLLVAEAVRERCAGLCDSNAAQEREGMAELTTQRDRLAAENAAHMAEMIGAEIRSLDLSGVGVG